jgi:serine/threonine-protein kinase
MAEQPPAALVATLERLGLATAQQIARMGRRVRRLARDLPRFESVWVDALLQARILTSFQAAELNAGRGPSLRIGPYVLLERLAHPYYVACYRGRNVESQEAVRLAVIENAGPRAGEILAQLKSLGVTVGLSSSAESTVGPANGDARRPVGNERPESLPLSLGSITDAGADSGRIFAAAPWVEGRTAAEWIVHHGRFPGEVVLEIARTMLAGLAELEKAGICHGDLSIASLILADNGGVRLSLPGVRGILRPEEGYAHADLPPEAYDTLAPERIAAGTPPRTPSEIYACGCVWWHLLCGRAPLAGGDSLARLRAAQAGEICDVRLYASDVPAALAAAISTCTEREPGRRPDSLARLASMLGPPTRGGKEALADCLARAGRPSVPWTTTVRSVRKSNRTPFWIAGTICVLAAAVATLWPAWHRHVTAGKATIAASAATANVGQNHVAPAESRQSGIQRVATAVAREMASRPPGPQSPGVVTGLGASAEPLAGANQVVPAGYQQVETSPPDLVLAADKPLMATSLDLRPGQRVRGPSGKRAVIVAVQAGLVVDKENVRFENVDFVWHPSVAASDAQNAEPALVQLRASRAEFQGCSFQGQEMTPAPVSAVRWVHPARAKDVETALPSGRLRLADCLFRNVGVGLDCRTVGALAIELKNTLRLGGGPLVRLDHCPQADEPASIVLEQVTLRGGGPLLECLVPRSVEQPAELSVVSTACAFVPEPGTPLVRLTGAEMPLPLLGAVRWTGQGSLLAPQIPVIAWRGPGEREEIVDESSLSIAGLVRSAVGFAGQPSTDPAGSRLIRWQAPLQSADPPGIDPAPLPPVLK